MLSHRDKNKGDRVACPTASRAGAMAETPRGAIDRP
jgi:hypothetical protein